MPQIDLRPIHEQGDGGLYNTELTNGPHTLVTCRKCNKSLCDIWMTQPSLDVNTKLVATCDYCGDRSYDTDVKGKFHLGITDDSSIVDLQHDFIDGPTGSSGIYQKMRVITKRTK